VDLIMTGDDVTPRFGQVEKLVDDYVVEMGGSCLIFAWQAARLGLRVGILGRVGDDDFGRLVLRRLDEYGVDTSRMIVDPSLKTGLGIALCPPDDRAVLTHLGSLPEMRPDDVTDEFLASARHLHHGSFFLHTRLLPHVPAIFRRAKELGFTTSLDPNWDPDERWNSTLAPDFWLAARSTYEPAPRHRLSLRAVRRQRDWRHSGTAKVGGCLYSRQRNRQMTELTSRERMLRTLNLEEADHIPCCFMSFTALRKRCNENMYELAKAERAMGLDAMLFIPIAPRPERPEHPDLRGLPVRRHPKVKTKEWREQVQGDFDVLCKEYATPGGKLTTNVRLSEDWPHGEHIPFIDDYQVPRAIKPLITQPEELDALQYMLTPPAEEDIARFGNQAQQAHAFVEEHGVLLAGGWGVGMDMANWLCGMENLMILTLTQPAFVDDLLEMIHVWNTQRMEVVLSAPVDLYIRRAWYEGCDFVTPKFYRQAILPRLKAEVDLAHRHGVKFGYICSSGTKPMLDFYLEAGIDVLIGIDPVQGTHTDMPLLKDKLGDQVCLWGGVSGAVTVEMGTETEIRSAVQEAVKTLGSDGFVLSPVDNITVDVPSTWHNIDIFIDEWRRHQ
jgi:uroporphyrinogen-III decarboxylase